jgi:hypothetical protein
VGWAAEDAAMSTSAWQSGVLDAGSGERSRPSTGHRDRKQPVCNLLTGVLESCNQRLVRLDSRGARQGSLPSGAPTDRGSDRCSLERPPTVSRTTDDF